MGNNVLKIVRSGNLKTYGLPQKIILNGEELKKVIDYNIDANKDGMVLTVKLDIDEANYITKHT